MPSLSAAHKQSVTPLLQRLNSALECLSAAEQVKDTDPLALALVDAAAAYETELKHMLQFPDDRSVTAVETYQTFMEHMMIAVNKKGEAYMASFRPRLIENGLRVMVSHPDAALTVGNFINTADAFIKSQTSQSRLEHTAAMLKSGVRRGLGHY
jgi:hypothetical protein